MPVERRWSKSRAEGTLRDGLVEAEDREWVWVDLIEPDEASLQSLARRFDDLDELALEDALDPDLFPRFEDFGELLAVALRGLSVSDGVVRTTPLLCLVAQRSLITIHHEELPGLEFVVLTAKSHQRTAEGGPDRMAARLADVGSRRFEPVVDEIDALIGDCETRAALGESGAIAPLQTVRRQITHLRKVIRPQRSVMQSLVYTDSPLLGDRARRRLTDVLERHARLEESLDAARTLSNGVVEVHRGAVAERTNEVMKVLTIFSATLLPMTLIAGVYGMNFSNIPELDYRYGYPIALAVMITVGVTLWGYFARRGFVGRPPTIGQLTAQTMHRLSRTATLPVRTVGSLIADRLTTTGRDPSTPPED